MEDSGDFIRRYVKYTESQESPLDFHVWMAMGIIGAASARNVWIDMNYFKVYPNNYIILCSGSAKCRKGIAIDLGVSMLRKACEDRKIISEKITPEALISQMSKVDTEGVGKNQHVFSYPLTIYSDELGVFMSKSAQNSGMPMLLTRLYTCPDIFEYMTKTAGTNRIRECCLSLFAGTTPGWLQRNVGPDSFEEGFVGRTIFVYGDTPRAKNPWPERSVEEARLEKLLIPQLKGISEVRGELVPTKAAKQLYADWYRTREPEKEDEVNSGFFGREHIHVLKASIIFALSSGSGMDILDTHISAAIDMLRGIRANMQYALIGAGFEASVAHVAIVVNILKRHKLPMPKMLLARATLNRMTEPQLSEALDMLVASGRVRLDIKGSSTIYTYLE